MLTTKPRNSLKAEKGTLNLKGFSSIMSVALIHDPITSSGSRGTTSGSRGKTFAASARERPARFRGPANRAFPIVALGLGRTMTQVTSGSRFPPAISAPAILPGRRARAVPAPLRDFGELFSDFSVQKEIGR